MGVINFNGVSTNSKRFSAPILVEQPPDYIFPARDVSFTHVSGRNGDVLVDNGSYNNVKRSYNLAIGDENINFARLAYELSDWLHSANGYAKLTDSYDPEHYCMAAFIDEGTITNILQHAGRISVSFSCKPQRYLVSGDDTIELTTSGSSIFNPTMFDARPIIKITGSGTFSNDFVTLNSKQKITVNGTTGPIYIDSELMDCYSITGSNPRTVSNKNSYITFEDNKFPVITKGSTIFAWTSGITSVEVIPRWWTI